MADSQLTILDVMEHELGEHSDSGRPFSVRCPFHEDDTPSFRVYPDSDDGVGSYYCWGCGESGGPVWFLRKMHNIHGEDLRAYVRAEYGVELPERGREANRNVEEVAKSCKTLVSFGFFDKVDPDRIRAYEIALCKALTGKGKSMRACIEFAIGERGAWIES